MNLLYSRKNNIEDTLKLSPALRHESSMVVKAKKVVSLAVLVSFCMVIISSAFVLPEIKNGIITGKSYSFIFASGVLVLMAGLNLVAGGKVSSVVKLTLVDVLVGLYLIYTFIQFLATSEAAYFNAGLTELFFVTIVFYLSKIVLKDIRQHTVVLVCLLLSALFQSLVGLLQLYGYLKSYHPYFKVTGTFFNPSTYAGYLVSLVPITLSVYFDSSKIKWVRYLALITIVAVTIVLPSTLSRAAWLSALTGVVIFFVGRINMLAHLKDKLGRAIVYAGLAGVTFLLIIGSLSWKRNSALGRVFIWKVTTEIIKDNPVFGVGTDQYTVQFGRYQSAYFRHHPNAPEEEVMNAGKGEYAFNEFLSITAEKGFVGLLLFTGILFSAGIQYFKIDKMGQCSIYHLGASGGLVSIVVFSFFSYPYAVVPILLNLYIFLSMLSNVGNSGASIQFRWRSAIAVRFVIFLLAGASVAILFRELNTQYKAMKEWESASSLKAYRDYSGAIALMKNVEPILDNNGQFMFDYGQTLMLNADYSEGIHVLERASKLTSDPYLFTSLGYCYQRMKNFDKAEEYYEHAFYLMPYKFYPRYLLAKLYLEAGENKKARAVANQILTMKIKVSSEAIYEMKLEMHEIVKSKGNN